MENNLLKLFAGYQFQSSSYYSRADLEGAILRAVNLSNESGIQGGFSILFELPELAPGEIILSQVLTKIQESDICIFEISNENRNVFFEVGVAAGLNIPIILLRQALSELPVPSDLSGVVLQEYSNINELNIALPKVLTERIKALPKTKNENIRKIANYIWPGTRKENVEYISLIGGEIKAKARSDSETKGKPILPSIIDVYYMQFPDVQALVEAGGNLKYLSPDRDIRVVSSEKIGSSDLEENLILVGGPKSNRITKDMLQKLSLPWKYRFGNSNLSRYERMKQKALVKDDIIIRPEFDKDQIKKDVALLAFGPNPFNSSKRFLLLTGAFTFGVMGATRSVSILRQTEKNILLLNNLCDQLNYSDTVQIVMQVDVVNGQAITPSLEFANIEVIK